MSNMFSSKILGSLGVLSAIVLFAIAVGFAGKPLKKVTENKNISVSVGENSTSTNGSVAIKEIPVTNPVVAYSSSKMPDFRKQISIPDSFSDDSRLAVRNDFSDVQKILSKDSGDISAWMKIGSLRKMTGDYAGAEEDWVYVSKISPNSVSVLDSLGSLYMDFIKDYVKAEMYYERAIQIMPKDINAYHALYSLYDDYGYKSKTSSAGQILKRGIEANPNAYDLMILLARDYLKNGDTASAITEYNSAISAANKSGLTDISRQISDEESKIKQ